MLHFRNEEIHELPDIHINEKRAVMQPFSRIVIYSLFSYRFPTHKHGTSAYNHKSTYMITKTPSEFP